MTKLLLHGLILVASLVTGAFLGNLGGLAVSVVTKSEYTKRIMKGLVFGSTTVAASVYLLRWLSTALPFAFLVVLVATFVGLTLRNYVQVRGWMGRHRYDQAVYGRLSELSRTRLVQDLTATIAAFVGSLVTQIQAA